MPHGEPFSPLTQRQCCDNWRKSPPCLPIPLLEAKTGLAFWRATASIPSTCHRTQDCCQRLRKTSPQQNLWVDSGSGSLPRYKCVIEGQRGGKVLLLDFS